MENIARVLDVANSSLSNIIKVNVYLSDLPRDFTAMNEVYLKACAAGSKFCFILTVFQFFPHEPPARTCIGVAALPLGALVEIECVAAQNAS